MLFSQPKKNKDINIRTFVVTGINFICLVIPICIDSCGYRPFKLAL